ncbi:hypothetical protein [Nocardioides sp. 1609]|uniref:hypothetical protein n=1 Tax=Nocardioides sp. 1609 TaxID=2508327 RepID=UPI00106F5B5E|nr:hypothetical protein [Nocardioides sp. 1609]
MPTDIEVSYAAVRGTPTLPSGRPVLTWGTHPEHGTGWTLWHLVDPTSESAEVADYFIPGDLPDIDLVVRSAQAYLDHRRSR